MKTAAYMEYRQAWDRRLKREEKELELKKELLFNKVRLCADKLRDLGARRITVFGSLATGRFRKDSDVDIAVEGLSAVAYFKALGLLEEMLDDISFDLVDMKEALPSVARRIKSEGIEV
jgi:predicted nucleotidyltransferase